MNFSNLSIVFTILLALLFFAAGIWSYFVEMPSGPANSTQDKAVNEKIDLHFQKARDLYLKAEYRACLKELKKLKALTKSYKNSKEIESFCNEGMELVHLQERHS